MSSPNSSDADDKEVRRAFTPTLSDADDEEVRRAFASNLSEMDRNSNSPQTPRPYSITPIPGEKKRQSPATPRSITPSPTSEARYYLAVGNEEPPSGCCGYFSAFRRYWENRRGTCRIQRWIAPASRI